LAATRAFSWHPYHQRLPNAHVPALSAQRTAGKLVRAVDRAGLKMLEHEAGYACCCLRHDTVGNQRRANLIHQRDEEIAIGRRVERASGSTSATKDGSVGRYCGLWLLSIRAKLSRFDRLVDDAIGCGLWTG